MNVQDRDSGIFPREHLTPELRLALRNARAEVLEQLLRGVRWLALLALGASGFSAVITGLWPPTLVYGVLFLGVLALSLARTWSLAVRGGLFMGLIYVLGVVSLLSSGLEGSGRVILLAFAVLTTVLFGTRAGLNALLGAALTWAALAVLFLSGLWRSLDPASSLVWQDWLVAGATLVLFIVALILPQRQFVETQAFALATSEQKRELEKTREALLQQKAELEAATNALSLTNEELLAQSRALERRASQLAVSAEVARAAATLHDVPTLLDGAVRLISEKFGFYHSGIFLLDEDREWAVLRAASSPGGQEMLARRHRLRAAQVAGGQQGIVGFVAAFGQPRIALNVGEDAVHFRNPLLPETQSEMALPLRGSEGIIGALDVQSTQLNAFTDDDIAVLQSLADQLAVAIENARLLVEKERNLEALRLLQVQAREQSGGVPVAALPQAYRYDGVDTAPLPVEDATAEPGALEIPIRAGNLTLGTIAIRREQEAWSENELELSEAVAERMGLALENARLYFDARTNAQRMAALSEAALELTGPQFSHAELLQLIVRRARTLLRADSADLWLPVPRSGDLLQPAPGQESDEIELAATHPPASYSLLGRRLKIGEGLAGQALARGGPVTLNDYQTQPGQMSALAVPMSWQTETLGVLTVNRLQPDWRYSAEDETVARLFAAAAASALSNARLLEETRRRLVELQTVNSISAVLSSQADLEVMLRQVGDKVMETFGVQTGYIALYDPARRQLEFPYRLENGQLAATPPIPLGRGPTSVVFQSRQPLLINQNAPQRLQEMGAYLDGDPALSFLSVPILVGDEATGILNVQSTSQAGLFDESDIQLLNTIAANIGVAIENARLFKQTQSALAETEALYRASAELNTAQGFNEVLAVLRRQTVLRRAHTLQLHYFERPWTAREAPGRSEIVAHWSIVQPEALDHLFPVALWMTRSFRPDDALLIENLQHDQRLDDISRNTYRLRYSAQAALFTPLVVSGEWVGYLAGFIGEVTVFSEGDRLRLVSLSQQAAALIENLRSIAVIERRAEQLGALNRLAEAAASNLDLDALLTSVCREMTQAFQARSVTISLLNPERDALVVAADYSGADYGGADYSGADYSGADYSGADYGGAEPGGVAGHLDRPVENSTVGVVIPLTSNPSLRRVVESRRPLVLAEAQTGPLSESLQSLMRERKVESLLVTPLVARGEVMGVIGIDSDQPRRAFTEAEVSLAETMAGQVSNAIENSRLYQQAQRRAQQLITAAEVSRAATTLLDERELLQRVVELIHERFRLYYVGLFLLDESGRWAVLRHAVGGAPEGATLLLRQGHQLEVGGQSMIGWAIAQRAARIASDVAEETMRYANPLTPETRSEMALPLVVGPNVLGALSVQSTQRHAFTEADVAVLQSMADQIAASLQNARLFRRVQIQEWSASALARMAQSVSGKLEEQEVWATLAAELLDTFHADGVAIYGWDAADETVLPRVVLCEPEAADVLRWPTPGQPAPLSAHPELTQAVATQRRQVERLASSLSGDLRESVIIPLTVEGRLDSLVALVHSSGTAHLGEDDFTLLEAAVRSAESAVQIARLYALQRETAERLQEVDRLKSQFLANMSHELRTPLNSIIGFSRVILKGIDGPVTETQRQDLTSIYNSGQHLLGLINDILDLSRIEAGKIELSFDQVYLGEIFDGVLATTRGLVRDKSIELHKHVPADLPPVRADATRVRQVLLNLCSNAAKFTERGSVTVSASVILSESVVQISVTDTGQGIPAHEMDKLFERFSQVDGSPTRRAGGTGLGLNISRHLVELHGGRIWAESEGITGRGSTFSFTLPLWVAEPEPEPVGPPLILVIEDDRGVSTLYRRYLEPNGYQLLSVSDSEQAVARAAAARPAAILLDVFMPNKDGWQVLTELKRNPATSAIPVIVCTLADDRERALQLGAAEYLLKPILETDLTRALGRLPGLNRVNGGAKHS
jgi:GAF domain-containing protein/CheY-like chemotaxis protein